VRRCVEGIVAPRAERASLRGDGGFTRGAVAVVPEQLKRPFVALQTDRSVYAARVSDRDDREGREDAAGDASTRGARLRAGLWGHQRRELVLHVGAKGSAVRGDPNEGVFFLANSTLDFVNSEKRHEV
jgi:hypothetical protein